MDRFVSMAELSSQRGTIENISKSRSAFNEANQLTLSGDIEWKPCDQASKMVGSSSNDMSSESKALHPSSLSLTMDHPSFVQYNVDNTKYMKKVPDIRRTYTNQNETNSQSRRVHFHDWVIEIEPQKFSNNSADQSSIWYSKKEFASFELQNRQLVMQYRNDILKSYANALLTTEEGKVESQSTESTSDETSEDSTDEQLCIEYKDMMIFNEDDVSECGIHTKTKTSFCLRGLENIMSVRAKVSLLHRFRDYHNAIQEEQKRQKAMGISDPDLLSQKAMAASKISKKIALNLAQHDAQDARRILRPSDSEMKTDDKLSCNTTCNSGEIVLDGQDYPNVDPMKQKKSSKKKKKGSLSEPHKKVGDRSSSGTQTSSSKKNADNKKWKNSFSGFSHAFKNGSSSVQIEFNFGLEENMDNASIHSTRTTLSGTLGKLRDRMRFGSPKKNKTSSRDNDYDNKSKRSICTEPAIPSYGRRNKNGDISVCSVSKVTNYKPPVSSTSFTEKKKKPRSRQPGATNESITAAEVTCHEDIAFKSISNDAAKIFANREVVNMDKMLSGAKPNVHTQTCKEGLNLPVTASRVARKKTAPRSSNHLLPDFLFEPCKRTSLSPVYTPETSMSSISSSESNSSISNLSISSSGSKENGGILKKKSAYEAFQNKSLLEPPNIGLDDVITNMPYDRLLLLEEFQSSSVASDRIQI